MFVTVTSKPDHERKQAVQISELKCANQRDCSITWTSGWTLETLVEKSLSVILIRLNRCDLRILNTTPIYQIKTTTLKITHRSSPN
jgi:hypothetical protein